jgi:flagellar motor switch protein FliM
LSNPLTEPKSVLRKKLRPRAPSRAPCHAPLERHADEIFRKTAKSGFDLNIEIPEIHVVRMKTSEALESLPKIAVTMMLSSADGEYGLCVINGELNDGLIEQQTLGRIAKASRGDRAVTQIDAALCEGFVRHVLKVMETDLAATTQASSVLGYVCDKAQFDREELALILTAEQMDVLKVTIDMGPGIKTGCVEFWFPAKGAIISAEGVISNPVGPKLLPYVLDVEVGVNAMLDPVPISLGKMLDLKIGDTVEIPREALVSARIMDSRGVLVTRARLGQLNGRRAARITGIKPNSSVLEKGGPFSGEMDEGMIVTPTAPTPLDANLQEPTGEDEATHPDVDEIPPKVAQG